MGGGISKDGGQMHYRVHNIYLNFVHTYGRLSPTVPVTIHQKALFLFWMSCIAILLVLQTVKLITKFRCRKDKSINFMRKDVEKTGNDDHENTPRTSNADGFFTENNVLSETLLEEVSEEPKPSLAQKVFIFLNATHAEQPAFSSFIAKVCIFGAIMFYFWLTDFVHLWPKVDKQYSRDTFVFIFALLLVVSVIFTITKNNDKLINRDQTEEWKGWMQVQFVWYHYFDAQEVFNSIRCYIGAYVWMTGFGNLTFFMIKHDYSVFRLLKMMFRLNFLVIIVMAVTNHEFVRYYVCAMHTYWFLSVWAMLVVLNRYNKNRYFMAGKFLIYTIINALIFEIPGAPAKIFIPFHFILDVKGNLEYWIYRSVLDHWAAFVGMLVAYNYPYYEKLMTFLDKKDDGVSRKFKEAVRLMITGILVTIFVVWFYYILLLDRHTYIKVHPYTSCIPVIVYIWLRNLYPVLRTHHLNLLTWLGKITLETYLSQIHIYMIGDAKKILVYLPNYPLLNFMLATAIYLYVSLHLFRLTVFFSSYLLPRDLKIIGKNALLGTIWLAICYVLSHLITVTSSWGVKRTGFEFMLWNVTKS